MPSRCCGTSVGVIVTDDQGRMLMIERGWYPLGIAPVAGHVTDAHDDPAAALAAEVAEETGLVVTHHEMVWEGWLPNLCASPPAPIPGHHWSLATATVTGTLAPDPIETKGAAWYSEEEIHALAVRTISYARGQITDEGFAAEPGLEPVWLELLHTAGVVYVVDLQRVLLRRLYTTPPESYWMGDRLVSAAQVATRRV
ncbi:ADP-ribose pyrophosphatase YjhB (NUDIX family) [Lipingzhangella halophila]|uniref:ADP-ribose pyrophosphatase YjhB (NUDIX family) n=1 Tax=Lipingzhangella halophila TaxID=1783352 RepID=A0A7W7RMW8_9ACTN|nr:NUDIX hydrolase [Lipingzhangella halophila]MBB4929202.1 ADP-ribose pyrophosphatase YjhB (NUDIX family) [Lipingzhangella halophila]MBB4934702.1 ADP-ribose pyrophosphatase YjhB (NUDIX family) [Lipingzhangella halophila]